MARRVLWGSLALAPLTIILHYVVDLGDTADFTLAAAALIPLAWLIGEATEHASHHTGPGIGGFLNATFGNAPELIIALFAVAEAKFEVVRGSLGKRDRQPAARPRFLAALRRPRPARPSVELRLAGPRRPRGRTAAHPRGPQLERRSRA